MLFRSSAINSISSSVNSAISDFNRLKNALSQPVNAKINIAKTTTVSTVQAQAQAVAMNMTMARAASSASQSGVADKDKSVIENNIYLDSKLIGRNVAPIVQGENNKVNNRMKRLAGGV